MIQRMTTGLICTLLLFVTTITSAQMLNRTGKVAEVINVQTYTYLRFEKPETWVAVSSQEIVVGDMVEYSGGMEMQNFYSKALKRTFDSIIFVQNVSLLGSHPGSPVVSNKKIQNQGLRNPIKPLSASFRSPTIEKITPLANGNTVSDIVAKPAQFESKTIKLRAKVMKVNLEIMGKNWITLQDGTGTPPNHKLLTTSSEIVKVGDVVVASGIIKTDIDLGSGYKYKVILENATYTTESK